MAEKYSIAEAGRYLLALVRKLQGEDHIALTRRGVPVAVLLSIATHQRVAKPKRSFRDEYDAFRAEYPLEVLNIQPAIFTEARDRSLGREVTF